MREYIKLLIFFILVLLAVYLFIAFVNVCMNLKYYIIDNYEFAYHWEEYEGNLTTEDKAGHRLHETGTGNEYKIIGVYEDFIRWEAGETLYQNDYAEIKLDEEKYNAGPYR